MMYLLLNEIRKNKRFLNSDNLQNMTKEELQRILKGNIDIPLFNERYFNIINVAKTINSRMNGDFYGYIKDIQSDEELFEIIIDNFDIFKDTRNYEGHEIYFYKLAQLLVSDILHVYEIKDNKSVDYSHLAGCADYKIPQVMRNLGILEYSEELANLIDSMQELEENSRYEVEIRANMIVAISEIKKRLSCNICAMDINDYLWLAGQDKTKQLRPYHLTRTVSY